jgi:hypothetical protein
MVGTAVGTFDVVFTVCRVSHTKKLILNAIPLGAHEVGTKRQYRAVIGPFCATQQGIDQRHLSTILKKFPTK